MFSESKAFSGFSVDDVPGARKFYGETLGLDISEESGMLTLHLAGGRDTLIYPKPDHVPATFTILNFPVEDIERAVDELATQGVNFHGFDGIEVDNKGIFRGEGPNIAWFTDPAGNILAVIEVATAPSPRSSTKHGGAIMVNEGSTTMTTRVQSVSVPVANQDRALEFYTEVLGCELREDFEVWPGARLVVVTPPGSNVALFLLPRDGEIPVAVRLGTTDAEAAHTRLAESDATVHNDEVLRYEGSPPMFSFADPDGNGLVYIEEESRGSGDD